MLSLYWFRSTSQYYECSLKREQLPIHTVLMSACNSRHFSSSGKTRSIWSENNQTHENGTYCFDSRRTVNVYEGSIERLREDDYGREEPTPTRTR